MTKPMHMLAASTHTGHHHHHHAHHAATSATTDADPAAQLMHALDLFAIGTCSLVGLTVLGMLVGLLLLLHGRYRPQVGALAVALATPVAGAVAGYAVVGVAAAVPFVVGEAVAGFRLDYADRRAGKDRRRRAESRLGLIGVCRAVWTARHVGTVRPGPGEIIVGHTSTRIVKLVRGWASGRHVGVLGAPGSGKSTTIAALVEQHVCGIDGQRHGAVIVDPKGDPAIHKAARAAAAAAGAPLVEFTPQGGVVYDVLAGGDVDRRTDKILAAEE